MYKVQLTKYIWDNEDLELSSNWSVLTKELVLPFVPFVGLEIQLPLERAWRLRNVCWNIEGNYFHCHSEDLFTDPLSIDGFSFEDWIEHLTSADWKADGPYPKQT
ncbi:hypothetical protein LP416_13800 [Polaromonas sp. P2-4]|nr:hypothetical protein LP416_13800 [Polaromonas sp. P2-4]